MDSWGKRLDIAVNVAILCAFIMVAALAAQKFLSSRSNSEPSIGKKVSLSGVDWSKSKQNLVLALSTTCHFCSESGPFYKELITRASEQGVPVIAVLPQTLAADRTYLDGLGIRVSQVLQTPLQSIGVAGTPTLLIVDSGGKIRKAWVGKLRRSKEDEVMANLQ